ncbi:hypothetical protein HAX54_014014, partial [Datura stramonium]|nr:hypothetical protein [Datura stramonium]
GVMAWLIARHVSDDVSNGHQIVNGPSLVIFRSDEVQVMAHHFYRQREVFELVLLFKGGSGIDGPSGV